MQYQLSDNLSELLDSFQSDVPINLRELADQVIKLFGNECEMAKELLSRATGSMRPSTIQQHLIDATSHDSAVRDVITVGHLAKLLSRVDIFAKSSRPEIIGLPNILFDQQSQIERAKYFALGNILPIDAKILEIEGAMEMLARERSMNNGL